MSSGNDRPIGIFDSGIGGLTVFAAIRKILPGESLVYLGDTARVPYGTKSAETVIRYSRECAAYLKGHDIKAICVACNTASAYALPELAREFDVPVLGVIEPGARLANEKSSTRTIGVIGTTGTIASNAYGSLIKSIDPKVRVVSLACPLFVPLVEEGWIDNEVALMTAKRYLDGMRTEGIDTLILGCTHYPLMVNVIQTVVGSGVLLIDSGVASARALESCLANLGIAVGRDAKPKHRIYVTDLPARFESIANRFLEGELPPVSRVDL